MKLHMSHKMKPYPNVKTIWGLIYASFSVFWALEQVQKIVATYLKSSAWIYRNSLKVVLNMNLKEWFNIPTFPVVSYSAWKLELVLNILWLIVSGNIFFASN